MWWVQGGGKEGEGVRWVQGEDQILGNKPAISSTHGHVYQCQGEGS